MIGLLWGWTGCQPDVPATPRPRPRPAIAATATLLSPGPNVGLVQAQCTGCHSASLIRQQHMSRAQWDATITWMQDSQGLWDIPQDQRTLILDYLGDIQGPDRSGATTAEGPWAHPRYEPNPLWGG